MKNILSNLFFLVVSFNAYSAFEGCGNYILKGVLVKSESDSDQKKWGAVYYKINKKTQSEMKFKITNSDDLSKVSGYLNIPSELNVVIEKKINGTEGEIASINQVKLRSVHGLNFSENNGMFLEKLKGCN